MPLPPHSPDRPPFATDAELRLWLLAEGLEHAHNLRVEALAPRVAPSLWPMLRGSGARRPLVDLASDEGIARWRQFMHPASPLLEKLPPLAWQHLADECAAAAEARATIAERLRPPASSLGADAAAKDVARVHRLLCELRARVPSSVAPRPARALRPDGLVWDALLPGFRYQEPRATELVAAEGRLTIAATGARFECGCGAAFCVHGLGAIDAALLWLEDPQREGAAEARREMLRPVWERALVAWDAALLDAAAPGRGVDLTWRIDVLEGHNLGMGLAVEVAPYLHRRSAKGVRSAGSRMSRRRLLAEHGEQLSSLDARLVALMPVDEGPASRALLYELIGHPRLYLADDPELQLQIERARVGLVAEDRGGMVVVTAGLEGAALPAPLLDRVRRARPDEVLYLWDRGPRRLTLLDVAPDVRALLRVLLRHGNTFPPESYGALIEKLSTLAQRLPVAMPRSVMGASVALADRSVIRLAAQPGGRVRLELRTRPLPESAAFVPGEGARDVHVRRGQDPVHAVRDFARECAAASALLTALRPMIAEAAEPAEPNDPAWSYNLPSAQECLALVAACETIEPRPELEWQGLALRLSPSPGLPALKVVLERRRGWFGVLGELAVQGERVELARLLDAARRKERYVQVTGQSYVEIDALLRQHLERLSDHLYTSRHGLEVGPSAALALRELGAAGATVEADARWQTLVERIFTSRDLQPSVPANLKAELRDYQREGFRWLTRLASWGAGAVLADDMGLGKTVQALAVLLDRSKLGPALVLAPTSVAFNWIDEAKRFAPSLRLSLYADSEDRASTLERLGPGDVLVLSYGLLVRDAERLAAVPFATIVFDEAQALKNAATHRSRAARALQGDFKFALSGTPLENHLGELWSLYGVVFPGLLGSWEAFRSRYAGPIEKGTDPTAAPALSRVLQPFLLRRTKAQVEAELPPRTDIRVPVVLSAAEWQLYEDARLAALSDLETRRSTMKEQERRIEVLAALTRLRLLASHPRLYDAGSKLASSKLERLMELVRELIAEGQRALVFSQFTSHLALVREVLDEAGIAYEYLDGQTPQGRRGETVKAFQSGTAPLFLISLKAGGFGLNLTAATTVIHLDPWWNPAVEDQASDRAHRLGQTRPVTVFRLVARGTIEEQMLALHEHKRSLVAGVLEGKDQAGRVSTRDLMSMLSARLLPPGPIETKGTRH